MLRLRRAPRRIDLLFYQKDFTLLKNCRLYRLALTAQMDVSSLSGALARQAFQPCPSNEPRSMGWVPPREAGDMIHAVQRQWHAVFAIEDKVIPASFLRRKVAEEVARIEADQGSRPGRKQMREIKDNVISALLPKAFTRMTGVNVWIDPEAGWMAIDATSDARCDDIVASLQRAMDDDGTAALPHTTISPVSAMTDWLAAGEAPAPFSIDRECELRDSSEEKGILRYTRVAIDTDEVREHLGGGKVAARLAMTWNDRISFVLDDRMTLRKIQMLDVLTERLEESAEDAEDLRDAEFILFAGEMRQLIADLVSSLGGEAVPD